MQFLTSLFGGSENTVVTAILALGIVLALIVLGLWVLKVFFKASSNIGRGRNRRLSVVDSVAIDPKRQLLIVRRDNVEHLILTGGPQDLLVETAIPVERQQPVATRRGAPPASGTTDPTAPARIEPSSDAAVLAKTRRATLDRPRDLVRPNPSGKPSSLRYTGLMRPVSRTDTAVIPMNPERADHPAVDSATSGQASETSEQAKLGTGGNIREFKAEGN